MRHGVCVGDKFKTVNYGEVEIIAVLLGATFEVRFCESGAGRSGVALSSLRSGNIRDHSLPDKRSVEYQYPVGSRYESNNHGWAEIMEVMNAQRISMKFDNTGNVAWFQGGSIKRGTIADEVSIANIPEDYYVYGAFVEDICVYVGKGKGHRYKHCNSGTSSNFGLNKMFFEGSTIDVKILQSGLRSETSEELEKAYLKHYLPICNVQFMPGAIDAFGRFKPNPAKVAYYENKQGETNV